MEYGYYSFDFRCCYQYDEKQEEVRAVLVDTSTGRQDEEVQLLFRQLEKIVPLGQRQHILPQIPEILPAEAYVRACAAVKGRQPGLRLTSSGGRLTDRKGN